MFLTQWNVPGVLGYSYHYDYYGENNTGRVTFADNLYNGANRDATLDRSWYYEDMGRLNVSYTGSEARATIGTDTWGHPDGPYAQGYGYDVLGNRTHEEGWGGIYGSYTNGNPTYTSNRRDGGTYDLAGNYTAGGAATYDATGQQVAYTGGSLSHVYDGDRLRGKKIDHGVATYYVRSSVLGGQVVAEINSAGSWMRGYVYLGGQLLALQDSGVYWVHQEPYTKGQRFTTSLGVVTGNIVELDPWGGNTTRSQYSSFQPHLYTSYERDSDGGDDAMNRRYSPYWSRFSQPDPFDGSYDGTDPQSFNRYSYVHNDPVNYVDPSGLKEPLVCGPGEDCVISTTTWARFWDDRDGPSLSGLWSIGPHPDSPRGGRGHSQNPGQIKTITECQMFANIVAETAAESGSPADFVNKLWDKFAQDKDRLAWGSTGFKQAFKDDVGPDNSPNQVRHYVGGLRSGFVLGIFGNVAANLRESQGVGFDDTNPQRKNPTPRTNPLTPSNEADRRLNAVSTSHGKALMSGTIKPVDLPANILADVCQ